MVEVLSKSDQIWYQARILKVDLNSLSIMYESSKGPTEKVIDRWSDEIRPKQIINNAKPYSTARRAALCRADAIFEENKNAIFDENINVMANWMNIILFLCFISHVQKQAGDACHLIHDRLTALGEKVWYDKEANKLDVIGMVEGIPKANVFLIFATTDYFTRPYCIFELMVADAMNKPMVVVYETDLSKGGFADVGDFFKLIPEKFSHRVTKLEALPFRRRAYELEALMKHLQVVLQKISK